jgi:phosphatidate cytidylyltransferase
MMTTDSPPDPVDPAPTAQSGDGAAGPLEPVPYDPSLDELAGLPAEQAASSEPVRATAQKRTW